MPEAKTGDTVKINYTGTFEDGSVFDTSSGRDPLEFKIGEGQVIGGFEQAVIGMNIGESKTTKIGLEDAYGPHREEMVIVLIEKNYRQISTLSWANNWKYVDRTATFSLSWLPK